MRFGKVLTVPFAVLLTLVLAMSVSAIEVTDLNVELDDINLKPTEDNYIQSINRDQELEVRVQFTSVEAYEDVQVEARMRGYDQKDTIDDITDAFDTIAGRTYTKDLTLKFPVRMDQQTYKLRISIVDADGEEVSETYEIEIEADSHAMWIKDIILSPDKEVMAGRALLTTVRLQNVGNKDQDDGVKVKVSIPDLGISATDYIDELEEDDSITSEELYMRIPSCAKPGVYDVEVEVTYRNGDEDIVEYETIKVVEGDTCETAAKPTEPVKEVVPTVTAGVEVQNVVVGSGVAIYPVTFTSNDDSTRSYTVLVDSGSWATVRVSPSNVIMLQPGETETAYIYVSANEGAVVGPNMFSVTIKDGSKVLNQFTLTANVAEGENDAESWASARKVLEIGLVVLVVLVLILGLIMIIRKMRKDDNDDEEAQTYY